MDLILRTETVFGLFLLLSSACLAADTLKCSQSNPCHCVTSNGSVINLEPLAFSNGTARFNDELDHTKTVVWYNPCKPFNGQDECKDAAACAEDHSSHTGVTVNVLYAKQENVQWTLEDPPSLTYTYKNRKFEVTLECNETYVKEKSSLLVEEVTNTSTKVVLTSVCACYDGCPLTVDPAHNDEGGGLSPGSILVILFFVTVVVYLLGGIIYNKVLHGATGKELIPNVEFWMAFPKLVLDGVAFVCNCCRKRHGATGYDDV